MPNRRCCVPDLLAGLEAVASTLLDQDLPLDALPVICLWEHVARHVVRMLAPTVLARCARVHALCTLGLLGEAAVGVWGLMVAYNLPDSALPWPKAPGEPREAGTPGQHSETAAGEGKRGGGGHKGSGDRDGGRHSAATAQQVPAVVALFDAASCPSYDAAAWPGAPQNRACCKLLASGQIGLDVAACYGPWLTMAVERARAAWLLAAGGVRNGWRSCDPATGSPTPAAAAMSASAAAGSGSGRGAAGAVPAAAQQQGERQQQPSTGPEAPHACEAVEESLLGAAATMLWSSAAAALDVLHAQGAPIAVLDTLPPASARRASGGSSPQAGAKSPAPKGEAAARPGSPRKEVAGVWATGDGLPVVAAAAAGPPASSAQLAHAAACALLQLSEVEARRWMPAAGLEAALQAARLVKEQSDPTTASLVATEDLQHCGLSPHLWLMARVRVVELLQQAQHFAAAEGEARAALAECAALSEGPLAAQLLRLQAGSAAALGRVGDASEAWRKARRLQEQLGVADQEEQAWLLQLDVAEAAARLGERRASDAAWARSLEGLRRHAHAVGLAEMVVSLKWACLE
jgi:hypothetical protein